MNNQHTPGFYIIEEYRCKRLYDIVRNYTPNNTNNADFCCNITFDRMNTVQNINYPEQVKIDRAETIAYQIQKTKWQTKLLERLRTLIR